MSARNPDQKPASMPLIADWTSLLSSGFNFAPDQSQVPAVEMFVGVKLDEDHD